VGVTAAPVDLGCDNVFVVEFVCLCHGLLINCERIRADYGSGISGIVAMWEVPTYSGFGQDLGKTT